MGFDAMDFDAQRCCWPYTNTLLFMHFLIKFLKVNIKNK